ncbi:MAG TPA: hypothetical protein DER01_03475, partial [Phycisphaerales bacterium]|nr:hypothetical protein [Phycisphaerales bacterium]
MHTLITLAQLTAVEADQETVRKLLVWATLLPLVSSIMVLFLGTRYLKKQAGTFACVVMGISFACAILAAFKFTSGN